MTDRKNTPTRSLPKEEWGSGVMREMLAYVLGIYGRTPTADEAHQMFDRWQEEVERLYGR